MAFAGLAITLAGFALAFLSLGVATATSARLVLTLIGIAISLFGILGVLNPAYRKHAVWRR
jgi:uncharacterized membrane protein YgaE (UPF0421/DUF939 family)